MLSQGFVGDSRGKEDMAKTFLRSAASFHLSCPTVICVHLIKELAKNQPNQIVLGNSSVRARINLQMDVTVGRDNKTNRWKELGNFFF